MKKIFKKNQIIVTVLAILIVIAGYLKYTDANFNNKNKEVTNEIYESTYGTDDILSNGEIASLDENETGEAVEETTLQPGEAVMTSSKLTDFIIQARIDREQIRSKNKETLLEVINNKDLDENQKKKNTTTTVFGNELHRYSIADGIRDKNVLGFDPYKVLTFKDKDVRKVVARTISNWRVFDTT